MALTCNFTLGSLITPGGIATATPDHSPARSRVAHHPWRDRNLRVVGAVHPLDQVSLITPGGIATGDQCSETAMYAAVAHHPWRDRNHHELLMLAAAYSESLITPGGIATRATGVRRADPDGSLITPGGIATRREAAGGRGRARRSSPLEGSQPDQCERLRHG